MSHRTLNCCMMCATISFVASGPLKAQEGLRDFDPGDVGTAEARSTDVEVDRSQSDDPDRIRVVIETWDQRVIARMAEIEQKINSVNLQPLDAQAAVLDDVRKLLEELRSAGSEILEEHEQLEPVLEEFIIVLGKAPQGFRADAQSLRDDAKDPEKAFLKDDLESFAEELDGVAERYRLKQVEYVAEKAKIEKGVAQVRVCMEVADKLDSALGRIPDIRSEIAVQRFAEKVNRYVDVFKEAMGAMGNAFDRIEKAQPTPEPPKESPSLGQADVHDSDGTSLSSTVSASAVSDPHSSNEPVTVPPVTSWDDLLSRFRDPAPPMPDGDMVVVRR